MTSVEIHLNAGRRDAKGWVWGWHMAVWFEGWGVVSGAVLLRFDQAPVHTIVALSSSPLVNH